MEAASEIAERILPNQEVRVEVRVEVRHLMGAYIYRHPGHDDELLKWGFNIENWGSAFYQWIAEHFEGRGGSLAQSPSRGISPDLHIRVAEG